MAAFMYLALIPLLLSNPVGWWEGGREEGREKREKKEGVLTCRCVVLNSAALERQTGRGEERVTKRRRGKWLGEGREEEKNARMETKGERKGNQESKGESEEE